MHETRVCAEQALHTAGCGQRIYLHTMDRSKFHPKPLLNTPRAFVPDTWIEIDGKKIAAEMGEPLIDAINRKAALEGITGIPQVC